MKYYRLTLAAALLAVAGTLQAQEEGEQERDMSAVQCLRVVDIRSIDIVDSDTLIFRMRNGDVYQNDLPHRCPGLRRNDTLMYRTSVGRLCNVDIVTVLDDWGFGFHPGASCGLGMFHPITDEIADELMRAADDSG